HAAPLRCGCRAERANRGCAKWAPRATGQGRHQLDDGAVQVCLQRIRGRATGHRCREQARAPGLVQAQIDAQAFAEAEDLRPRVARVPKNRLRSFGATPGTTTPSTTTAASTCTTSLRAARSARLIAVRGHDTNKQNSAP